MKSKTLFFQNKEVSEKQIKEGCDIYSGYAFKSENLTTNGIPVVKIGNIQDRNISLTKTQFFPNHLMNKRLEKFLLEDNDVLIAMTGQGSVGRIGKIRLKKNQKVLLNQRVGKFVTNEKHINSEYLYQILSSEKYEQVLFDAGTGSGQPNLSPDVIKSIKIPLPEIEIQRKIGRVLGAFDDMCWTLKSENNIMEKIIEKIFKSWFIDFDGQTEFEDTEFEKIPKGWKIKRIEEVAKVVVGYVGPVSKHYCHKFGGIPMIRTTDLKEDGIDYKNLRYVTKEFHEKQKKSQLRKGDILVARFGSNGLPCVYEQNKDANCLNAVIIKPDQRKCSSYYLLNILKSTSIQNQFSGSLVGSVQDILNTKTISSMPILIPSEQSLGKFILISNNIYSKINHNNLFINNLKSSRKKLLMKLMSEEFIV